MDKRKFTNKRKLSIRANIMPKKIADYMCFALLFISIPLTFMFIFIEVLPTFHSSDQLFFYVAWLTGIFIMFNIEGNFFACMLVDTSIKSTLLIPPMQITQLRRWHFCDDCETLVPERTSHCHICSTCILKRDHHCLFTGYCVGQRNQRYFIMLLMYLAIGSGATTFYASMYLWSSNNDIYANFDTFIKMIFPLMMFVVDISRQNFYLLIYELNAISFLLTSVLLVYHIRKIRTDNNHLGWHANLQIILGKRIFLTLISPLVSSDDGIMWEMSKKR